MAVELGGGARADRVGRAVEERVGAPRRRLNREARGRARHLEAGAIVAHAPLVPLPHARRVPRDVQRAAREVAALGITRVNIFLLRKEKLEMAKALAADVFPVLRGG